jgi:hypothetical protein
MNKLEAIRHLEDLGTDGRAILKRIFKNGRIWTEFLQLRIGTNDRLP